MEYSYWERKNWFSNIDLLVIGSGIVGLNCALAYKQQFPTKKVVVVERGLLPQGASTKNAGFACFGSLSELINDVEQMGEEELFQLTKQRVEGLALLKANVGEQQIGYEEHGGYEYFFAHQTTLFEQCESKLDEINQLLQPLFPTPVFQPIKNLFGFGNCLPTGFYNRFEGQIETGQMMQALLRKAITEGVLLFNQIEVNEISEQANGVSVLTSHVEFYVEKVAIATNGLSRQFLDFDLQPARAQVIITEKITDLPIKGTFHLDKGYFYFRNIDNRILLGGARNEDIAAETTTNFGQSAIVQNKLEQVLREVIVPNKRVNIEQRWSGIMGMGKSKQPIVQRVSNRIACGVRLGGMGIAIGSSVGAQLAHKLRD